MQQDTYPVKLCLHQTKNGNDTSCCIFPVCSKYLDFLCWCVIYVWFVSMLACMHSWHRAPYFEHIVYVTLQLLNKCHWRTVIKILCSRQEVSGSKSCLYHVATYISKRKFLLLTVHLVLLKNRYKKQNLYPTPFFKCYFHLVFMCIYVVHDGPTFLLQISDQLMVSPLCRTVNRCLIRNIRKR